MPSISGQSILVIGGTSGIGFAVAQLAGSQGVARIAVASSNPSRVADAVQRLEAAVPGAKVSGHTCDINIPSECESNLQKLLTDATADGGLLDHIVYTANRITAFHQVADMTAESLQNAVQIPYVVPFLLAKLAPKYLNKSYKSSITLTSGQVGFKPIPGFLIESPLATSIMATGRALAIELAPIRVNVVSPGPTNTEMWGSEEDRNARTEMMKDRTLVGKPGTADEVAEAYIYIMRDTNITGTVVASDAGVLLK
ncbi:NAD(P)-binding protein [Thozetella sp. PMI_491]|nr:NAD(P)-binding protein [Thozetella sp. PMI_491]